VVLKDGMAQRVPGAALIGAAGDVSLEQVQAAARPPSQRAGGARLSPERRASRQRGPDPCRCRLAEGRRHRRRPPVRSCCPRPALT
jgi:hypothetical protein